MAIKVGILGFAHGHVMSYGGQWLAHPELEVEMKAGWDHDAQRLENCANQLGGLKKCATPEELLAEDIEKLIEERQAARKAKNFQRADEIRNELLEKGIILEDTREGVKWKKA